MELNGAVCVVTGGAKGIGRALVHELRAGGARVVVGDIDTEAVHKTAKDEGAVPMVADVRDKGQVRALAERAVQEFGRLDIWINDAGIWMPYTPAEDIDFARAHELMEVNFFGLAYGTVEAMEKMRTGGGGAIVNIISVRGLQGRAQGAAYAASKFAAEGFTQSVRTELKTTDHNIALIGIYPYRTKTELFGENEHDDYEDSMEPAYVASVIIKNLQKDAPAEHVEIWSESDVRAR
ncbi:MAG: SDR family oxidoreductase [bacterium]|nr:SDR family oxidoreductase [bacterium]